MVGLVLVSHSRPLALAVQGLVRSMSGPGLPLAIAAGVGENHGELGTDAVEISDAIISVQSPDGVLVMMDMGSAILSSETALDLMEEKDRQNVRFCAAPFVEGAVAAGVTANLGASLNEVYAEAVAALKQKVIALGGDKSNVVSQANSKERDDNVDARPSRAIRFVIQNPHGLHARPAARLIQETKPFTAEIVVRNLTNRRGPVSIKSLSSLASLEILQGSEIELVASGPDAEVALAKIEALVRDGFGEALTSKTAMLPPAKDPAAATDKPVPISSGVAIGPVFLFESGALQIPQDSIEDTAAERARLQRAAAAAESILEARRDKMAHTAGREHAAIYDAQRLALQDPELIENALHLISGEHKNAAQAWDEANRRIVDRYRALQNEYLRERSADILDVGRLVLECLGIQGSREPTPDVPSILIANDLTPQQVAGLNKDFILGVILLDGGPTAHSSILLKALGVPAVVQARPALPKIDEAAPVLLAFDGRTGKIWIDPSAGLVEDLQTRQKQQHRRDLEESLACDQPVVTLDGRRIEVFANLGQVTDATAAARSGADGVGLLRTEFLFLNRNTAPTENEQIDDLREIASKFKHRSITVRTLDIGGDKEVSYLKMPEEDNPFLGVRALRLCFVQRHLFTTQLRAILRAADGMDFKIMFPMVAELADLLKARACLDKVHADLQREGLAHRWPIEVGIMIEIPSAALQVEALAEHADFFSIGTNDLTQYTMAADRGNAGLGDYQDALHPSVLRLIDMVVKGAQKRGRMVAVCGEAASGEASALIFAGLGVQELSVTAAAIPRLKAFLRTQSWSVLRDMANLALECGSAPQVRELMRRAVLEP